MKRVDWTTFIRRGLAYLVAAGLVVVVIGSFFGLHVCRDALATVGAKAVVTTCAPIGLTELAPAAVLIALLLIPDMSQIDLFGVVSLHREVKEQGRQLASELVQVRNAVTQAVNQSQNVNIMLPADPRQARADLDEKTNSFLNQPPGFGFITPWTARKAKPPATPARARREQELIAVWEDIRAYLGLLGRPSRTPSEGPVSPSATPIVTSIVQDWSIAFADQIDVVRAARNSVAHAVPISEQNLTEALSLGRQLLEVLNAKLDQYRGQQP